MNKVSRRIGVFAGFLVLFGSIATARFMSQQKEPPKRKASSTLVKRVDTILTAVSTVESSLDVQGELAAYDKIDLFAEVSGTLKSTSRPFKVGSYFPKGAVLFSVDKAEAELNLLSQKSNLLNAITQLMPDLKIDYPESFSHWQQYLDEFELEAPIKAFPEPANKQEKYFIASRNLYSQYYTIKSAEERLSKYQMYAPFSGVITEVGINEGAVVRAGQKLGELMSTNSYELVTTLPLRDLQYIDQGSHVRLYSEDISGTWNGRVKRINNQVETGTQTVKVFIQVEGKGLKEGMYLRGSLRARDIDNATSIPRNLLVNQNAVYVVEDSILTLHEVQLVKITNEEAIIRGLDDNTPILASPIPGAFEGMKVTINKKG
jgi:membrane fusion protein (multidrug efflux system)